MKLVMKSLLLLGVTMGATSAHAALNGCGKSKATFVTGVEIVQYPSDFCPSGFGMVLAENPNKRICVVAANEGVTLEIGRTYSMCVEEVYTGFVVRRAQDSRAE